MGSARAGGTLAGRAAYYASVISAELAPAVTPSGARFASAFEEKPLAGGGDGLAVARHQAPALVPALSA